MADHPVLTGRGDRDIYNGATSRGDDYMHLGQIDPISGSHTLCGAPIDGFLLTYADVEITCPACTEKLENA